MCEPINDCIVFDSRTAFDGSKAQTVDTEGQTLVCDGIAVTTMARVVHKLVARIFANIALLAVLAIVLGVIA